MNQKEHLMRDEHNNTLKDFYSNWYNKTSEELEFDINVCADKVSAGIDVLRDANIGKIDSILDMGCGYGRCLSDTVSVLGAKYGMGCDISKEAIDYGNKNYKSDSIEFVHLSSMDVTDTVEQITKIHSQGFDVTLLYDVLEHIPRPKGFIKELSKLSKYFLIELPIFDTVMDNYMLPKRMKSFASSNHPNGHFWDFTVNNVYHFVVSLGFTPIAYDFKKYSLYTQYPPHLKQRSLKGWFFYRFMKYFNAVTRHILPNRIFLRLVGKGCFVCLAKWSPEHVLD